MRYPRGIDARDYLRSRLPDNAQVNITPIETDRYGRTVAEIFLGERQKNKDLFFFYHFLGFF